MSRRVLVVDDDQLIREMTRDALAQEGFRVHLATSGNEALEWLGRNGPVELLLTDLSMREMDGFELMEQVRQAWPSTEVVVLTGYASLESALAGCGESDWVGRDASMPSDRRSRYEAVSRVDLAGHELCRLQQIRTRCRPQDPAEFCSPRARVSGPSIDQLIRNESA